ncbi:MAG: hypothetical protein ABW133_00485 [Polyangiaceae bacterium]
MLHDNRRQDFLADIGTATPPLGNARSGDDDGNAIDPSRLEHRKHSLSPSFERDQGSGVERKRHHGLCRSTSLARFCGGSGDFVAHGLHVAVADAFAAQEIEELIGRLAPFQRANHVVHERRHVTSVQTLGLQGQDLEVLGADRNADLSAPNSMRPARTFLHATRVVST